MTGTEHHTPESVRYHQYSKNPYLGHMPVPEREEDWPKEWTTTYYKSYPRFPEIVLPHRADSYDLFATLQNRRSPWWSFTGAPLSAHDYGTLLRYAPGIVRPADTLPDGRVCRAYPSAGFRFPLETYVIVFHGDETIAPGLYHYNIKGHALTVLWEHTFTPEETHELARALWIDKAAALIVHTAVFWRTQTKYGERGYRYALLEAGHIAQNMQIVATALGVHSCPLGGTNDGKIEALIDIDGVNESLVYTLAIGR